MNTMRINGFNQIKEFYSWVFNNPDKARSAHVSLYMFFINQANRNNWVEWFKCPYDLAMQGGCIGSKSTYYKILTELQGWGLIKYKPGVNISKAPLISVVQLCKNEPLTGQVPVPISEPQREPLTVHLLAPLTGNKYKLLTNNIKRITDNLDAVVDFLNRYTTTDKVKSWRDDFEIYKSELNKVYEELINNSEFIAEQEKFHSDIDIKLSLEKAVTNFWGKEAGWKHKKKDRTTEIDWKATLAKAIDLNKVYANTKTNIKSHSSGANTQTEFEYKIH